MSLRDPTRSAAEARSQPRPAAPEARPESRARDRCVARHAAEAWGVLSAAELRRCGLTDDAIRARARAGRLHRVHWGVYAVGHPGLTFEGRVLAAVKACGRDAHASHRSAAVLWGPIDPELDRRPEVTVPAGRTCSPQGVRVHRTRRLEPEDVTVLRGVPVTSPARTIADLAAEFSLRALRRLVRQTMSLGLVNAGQLHETVSRLGPRKGAAKLRRILAEGPAPTRSELEDVVLDLILNGGLERPDVNVPIRIWGKRLVPDFRWPEQRLIIEADGRRWHEGKVAREDDAERQALLEAAGERVLRVTWRQAVGDPSRTLARIRAAGAPAAAPDR